MLTQLIDFLGGQSRLHPWVFIPILILIVVFVVLFLAMGFLYLLNLGNIRRKLAKISEQVPHEQVRGEIEEIFEKGFVFRKHLLHLWKEYRDTLHEQRSQRGGQMAIVAIRATIPAEVYLNNQSVVDSRLYTEFFKHLPGILTGLGIIGTFVGLMHGLHEFAGNGVSENAVEVRKGLGGLMGAVQSAFTVSAFAIAGAMAVTFFEKLLLAALYRQCDQIASDIDARFDTGAGEEYLSKLVKNSEESATHTAQLKDVLVSELGDILREISRQQIDAAYQQNIALGSSITQSIEQSLQAPLEKIAGSVQTATGGQSDLVSRMLTDVMSGFSQQLRELFGGQISGISQLNQQTGQAMQDAVSALNKFVGDIGESSRKASDDIIQAMSQTIDRIERHQKEMSEQLESAVSSMSQTVQSDIGRMSGASDQMVQSVSVLNGDIQASVEKMQNSVGRLASAADAFSNAGDKVSGVMGKVADVSAKLTEISGSLTSSSGVMQDVLRDYQQQRQLVSEAVVQLTVTVESARKEASLTGDRLKQIESAAQSLAVAQKQADEYLQGVNKVLADTHHSFAIEIMNTLNKANVGFHEKLSKAVNMLSSAIEEFETTLATSGARK